VGALVPSPLSAAWGTREVVPAAKAAWSRTTPRNPAPASFATVSPRSPRRQMPRPPPGVGGTGAWARRDRMWAAFSSDPGASGRLAKGSVWPTTGAPQSRGPSSSHVRPGAVQTQAYASEDASPSASGPGQGARIAAAARPMPFAETHARAVGRAVHDACSACTKGPRLGSRRRRHRVLRNAARLGRQSHGCARSCWPPANTAEHHDHGSGCQVRLKTHPSVPVENARTFGGAPARGAEP
jgi:hypothetical protein